MGAIRETLIIEDRFTRPLANFSSLGDKVSKTLDSMRNKLGQVSTAHDNAAKKTTTHATAAAKANTNINALSGTVGKLVAALGGIAAVKGFVGLADSLTQTTARLESIKGEFAEVAELQDAIFAAAQSSRGNYTAMQDAVAGIMAQTEGVFNSTAEAVRFTELLNKQFTLAGTSASGVESTMYNLTQALATGALRGNDLTMVLSNAPALIQRIGRYLNKDVGEIRKMAQEGQITADIVKSAILDSGDDIDAAFKKMPRTFGQAMQQVKNRGIRALTPLTEAFNNVINSDKFEVALDGVSVGIEAASTVGGVFFDMFSRGLSSLASNGEMLSEVLFYVGSVLAGVALVGVAGGLAVAAAWLAANWPILLLGTAIMGAIAYMQSLGMSMQQMGETCGQVFGFIYALIYNVFANLWNVVASFAEFFANVWHDPLSATVQLFTSVFDAILGMVEAVANAIDTLMGSNLAGAVAGFRGKLGDWVSENYGDKAVEIKRMANIDTGTAMKDFGKEGRHLGYELSKLGGKIKGVANNISLPQGVGGGGGVPAMAAGGGGGKANVGTVDKVKDVNLSDEDTKIYRDLAERRYMANVELQTLAPNISVSIPESAAKNLTSQDIADKIKTLLIDQAAAHTAVAHAH